MECPRGVSFLLVLLLSPAALPGQTTQPVPSQTSAEAPASPAPPAQKPAAPIPGNAPHMSKQTRYEIIRDFETQLVYARTAFPMGAKGLLLKDGSTAPNGQDLQQELAIYGPAIKPGDPAQISWVQIKDNHIHFEINGGPIHRKKWYQHVEISGVGGTQVPLGPNEAPPNPHGTFLDIYFDKYVP